MLAIMLLSPPLARTWTPRIKRIILDEIHSIGQQDGGMVWEQIVLLTPCPIIGLSATVGRPEVFNEVRPLEITFYSLANASSVVVIGARSTWFQTLHGRSPLSLFSLAQIYVRHSAATSNFPRA